MHASGEQGMEELWDSHSLKGNLQNVQNDFNCINKRPCKEFMTCIHVRKVVLMYMCLLGEESNRNVWFS